MSVRGSGDGAGGKEFPYGVRPSSVHTLEDQLDAAPATASQIGDGYAERKELALGVAVGDF